MILSLLGFATVCLIFGVCNTSRKYAKLSVWALLAGAVTLWACILGSIGHWLINL